MIEVILLAIALAMDAFTVSIGLGASGLTTRNNKNQTSSLDNASPASPNAGSAATTALMAGLYFGVAQGVMPWLGYLLGSVMLGWLASLAPWIGCIILVGLGIKMIYEAYSDDEQSSSDPNSNTNADKQTDLTSKTAHKTLQKSVHKTMLTLAIATSIDAMGAGLTLNLLAVNAKLACLIIALITAGLSAIGVYIGKLSGTWLEDKAEILGGLVLIGIGIHMVV